MSKLRAKEYLKFDSRLFKAGFGAVGYVAGRVLGWCGQGRREFKLMSWLHRADCFALATARAEELARRAAAGTAPAIQAMYQDHARGMVRTPRTAPVFDNPGRMLGAVALVLKSPAAGEKGVLLLKYSHVFPLFARFFDVSRVAARYYLVLEPDWSGYCDVNVLSYSQYRFPVFVEAFEPRDAEVITATQSNLVAVPISTNWWIDERLFRPLPGVAKDVDVAVIAAWGVYKRHHRLLAALARLRRAGRRLRVLLMGYPGDMTRDDIRRLATYYGVADQLEIREWVPYEQVNEHLNRAKVNLLWSRREGVNRAIIEGMLAGVPCVLREGFNYGYRYPYINDQTGCFAAERDLPDRLLWMVDHHASFSPRQWVLEHLSCRRATEILSEVIGRVAAARGEPWTGGLAVRVNQLHQMAYWDPADRERFAADYEFLGSSRREE